MQDELHVLTEVEQEDYLEMEEESNWAMGKLLLEANANILFLIV